MNKNIYIHIAAYDNNGPKCSVILTVLVSIKTFCYVFYLHYQPLSLEYILWRVYVVVSIPRRLKYSTAVLSRVVTKNYFFIKLPLSTLSLTRFLVSICDSNKIFLLLSQLNRDS